MGELSMFGVIALSAFVGYCLGVAEAAWPKEVNEDEPIRLADGWWYPKAKNPPPPAPPAPPSIPLAPVSRPPETRRTAKCATH